MECLERNRINKMNKTNEHTQKKTKMKEENYKKERKRTDK